MALRAMLTDALPFQSEMIPPAPNRGVRRESMIFVGSGAGKDKFKSKEKGNLTLMAYG
jgi:hypothetical protein